MFAPTPFELACPIGRWPSIGGSAAVVHLPLLQHTTCTAMTLPLVYAAHWHGLALAGMENPSMAAASSWTRRAASWRSSPPSLNTRRGRRSMGSTACGRGRGDAGTSRLLRPTRARFTICSSCRMRTRRARSSTPFPMGTDPFSPTQASVVYVNKSITRIP